MAGIQAVSSFAHVMFVDVYIVRRALCLLVKENMSDIRTYPKQFIIEFIDLYKTLPCLWKIKCKDYSDRNKKTQHIKE